MELDDLMIDDLSIQAEICRKSLYEFIKCFWETIISEPMVDNWHIEAICNEIQPHLLRAIRKEKKENDIIANICPGTTKSTILSQMVPAWAWTIDPTTIILTSTNSDKLTAKNAMRSKDIITSAKYKELFPEIIIRKDASAKTFYQNTLGGARYSFTTKGSKIGNHGDILIEDDPTTARQAKSQVEMEAAAEGFKEFQTRKTNKETSLYILLMQRLSINDYTTVAQKKLNNVLNICLPAEESDLIQPPEFRQYYQNGLLDPVRLNRSILASEKKALNNDEEGTSEDDYDAQFDQDPKESQGLLYQLKYYDELSNETGAISLGAADIADSGTDYLAAPFAKLIGKKIYVHDAIYTQEGSATSADRIVQKTQMYNVLKMVCETNAMGATYINLLKTKGAQNIKGVVSKGNKMNRLISYAWIINEYFVFKRTGSPEYMKFLKALKGFLKTNKSEDDASDSVTLLAQYIYTNYKHIFKE
ncbi:hypothetical protein [Salinimicrobium sp. GXAS 041]|uniref:hypothetical protein n=1 Tax=Salinimicrobium sp. GXAS 041 TaxID=3400806 RepID=UPI003C728D12